VRVRDRLRLECLTRPGFGRLNTIYLEAAAKAELEIAATV
jgi:hypothetical protein